MVRSVLYVALLSLVMSRNSLALVVEYGAKGDVFPPGYWTATF